MLVFLIFGFMLGYVSLVALGVVYSEFNYDDVLERQEFQIVWTKVVILILLIGYTALLFIID